MDSCSKMRSIELNNFKIIFKFDPLQYIHGFEGINLIKENCIKEQKIFFSE